MGLEDLQPSAQCLSSPPPCPSQGACHTHSYRQHPDDPAVPLIPVRHELSGAGAPWAKPSRKQREGPRHHRPQVSLGGHSACLEPLAGGQRGVQGGEHPCRAQCVNQEVSLTTWLSVVCQHGGTSGSTGSAFPCGRQRREAVAAAPGEATWCPAPQPMGGLPVDVTCLPTAHGCGPQHQCYQHAVDEPRGHERNENVLRQAGAAALSSSGNGKA